jgi:flagellar hook protein FlgE
MPNSLLIGVTGLQAHQEMLDVVGNNLANENTVGFKSQRVSFADLVYQTLQGATTNTDGSGTNPVQLGEGVNVAAIDTNLQQGSLQATGNDLDMALQGNGYFMVNDGSEDLYTRAGAFGVDSQNYLVDPATGFRVQRTGATGEATATTPAFQTSGNNGIQIPYGTGIPGKATDVITLQGNLSPSALGPLAQVLTSAQPFKSGGVAATTATLLNNLDDNTTKYVAGDQLSIQGVTSAGVPVSVTMAVSPTTTLGDLINQINTSFAGSTASVDANGNLVVQANATGPSALSLSIADAAGDTGATNWSAHAMTVTTTGKDGDTVNAGVQIYDTQGNAHFLNLVFQKQSANNWSLTGSLAAKDGTVVDGLVSGITFNADGSFAQVTGTGLGNPSMTFDINGLATPQTVNFSFGTTSGFNGLTQFGGNSTAQATGQDGYAPGSLSSLTISTDGIINGVFTNGQTLAIAQLGIASFGNPGALSREGNNYYSQTTESGPALIGAGQSGGRGSVQQKSLEQSNVDVAQQLTLLIIAQQGFQTNSRTITTSNQVLQALANLIQ